MWTYERDNLLEDKLEWIRQYYQRNVGDDKLYNCSTRSTKFKKMVVIRYHLDRILEMGGEKVLGEGTGQLFEDDLYDYLGYLHEDYRKTNIAQYRQDLTIGISAVDRLITDFIARWH